MTIRSRRFSARLMPCSIATFEVVWFTSEVELKYELVTKITLPGIEHWFTLRGTAGPTGRLQR
jgi:hypothetical protein